MFNVDELLNINLNKNYKLFCANQCNCSSCVLLEKELIHDCYNQPCESVYNLLKIIQYLK